MLRVCGEAPDFDVERTRFDVVTSDVDRAGGVARGERAEVGQVADDAGVTTEAATLEDADCGGERAVDDELTGFDVGVAGVAVDAGEGQRTRAVLPEAAGTADGARDRGVRGGVEDATRAGEGYVIVDGRAAGEDRAAVIERQEIAVEATVRVLEVEGDELTAFNEGGGAGARGGGVVLGGDEEPLATVDAVGDNRGDVDDAGVFFVEGLVLGCARGEAATVRFEDLHGGSFNLGLRAGEGVHDPVLGDVGAITWVFLDVEQAVIAYRQVIEAGGLGAVLAGQFGAVDEDLDVSTRGEDAVGGVAVEVELVDLSGDGDVVHRGSAGARRGEDQGVMVEPVGVFGAGELGHFEAERFGLELGASLVRESRIVEDLSQAEGSVDAGGVLEEDVTSVARGGQHFDAIGEAVREAGLLDGVT